MGYVGKAESSNKNDSKMMMMKSTIPIYLDSDDDLRKCDANSVALRTAPFILGAPNPSPARKRPGDTSQYGVG
jgi:hypothetical protein